MRVLVIVLLASSCFAQQLTQLETIVVNALKEANGNLQRTNSQVRTLPNDRNNINSQRANQQSQNLQQTGDLLGETTRILVSKYGSGILNQLQDVDVNSLIPLATSNRVNGNRGNGNQGNSNQGNGRSNGWSGQQFNNF